LSQPSGFVEKVKSSPVEISSTQAVNHSPEGLLWDPVKSTNKDLLIQNSLKNTMLEKEKRYPVTCVW